MDKSEATGLSNVSSSDDPKVVKAKKKSKNKKKKKTPSPCPEIAQQSENKSTEDKSTENKLVEDQPTSDQKNGNKPTENKSIEIKATVPAVPVNTTAIQEKRGRLSFEERLKKQMESYFAQPPEIEKPHGEDVKTPNNSGKDVGELGAVGGATPSSPVGDDSRALFKKWSEEEAEKKLQEIILKDIEEKNKNKNEQESIDFTLDETEMALKDCAGWCGQLTEFEVFKKCSKSLKDEGCYIVWFWLKRKRPSISVTKNGKLKTYTIHKKTATESESRSYFIYEGQHKAPNMAKLVEHHTQEGLTDETVSTDNTVKFTTPL